MDPWTYEIIMDSYIINQIRNVSPLSFPIATSRPIDQRARAEAISRRALPLQAAPWLLAGLRGARMKSRKPIKNPNPKENISPAPTSDLHNDCRKGCAIGCMSSHPVAGSRNPRPSFLYQPSVAIIRKFAPGTLLKEIASAGGKPLVIHHCLGK